MIQLNPRYEAIFNPDNIDQDCDRIASLINVEADFIKEALDAGLYQQAVTLYLQLLQSMVNRNNYLTDIQFNSLYADCEELVKVLTYRCKKLDEEK